MKTILFAIMTACICVIQHNAAAQITITDDNGNPIRLPDLQNPKDQSLLKQRAKECVRQLNTNITSMTMKSVRDDNGRMFPTIQDRIDCRAAALELFLDNGDSITLVDGIKGAPALMETTVKRINGSVVTNTQPVKSYFSRLIDLIEKGRYNRNTGRYDKIYTEVRISSSDIESMEVTDIKAVGDRYQCIVSYTQDFIGKRGELTAYADRTKKQIVVWFVIYDSPWGKEVVPRLGDITAKDTESL